MFVPIVLEEDEAVAALVAIKSVAVSGQMFARNDEERHHIRTLASAMVKLAKDIDAARERATSQAVRPVPDVPRGEATR